MPNMLEHPPPNTNPENNTEMLHPLYFKRYINVSTSKIASDECCPEKSHQVFESSEVSVKS